jgi:GNAT superfamily N-acetyltransferase
MARAAASAGGGTVIGMKCTMMNMKCTMSEGFVCGLVFFIIKREPMEIEGSTVSCSMKRKVSAGLPSQEASPNCDRSSQKLVRDASRMPNEAVGIAISQFSPSTPVFLRYGTAKFVGGEVVRACFNLLKSNMEVYYKAAWSWKDSTKMNELMSPSARILSLWQDSRLPTISPAAESCVDCSSEDEGECDGAGDDSGWETEGDDSDASCLHAFAHYRFCMEEGILSAESEERLPVLYIWEMQVSETCRGRGLGRALMDMLTAIASAASMHSLVLTVFSSNQPAVSFYKHMGFDHTADCPSRTQSATPHFILSKRVPAEASAKKAAHE